jgi:hypothetical protein
MAESRTPSRPEDYHFCAAPSRKWNGICALGRPHGQTRPESHERAPKGRPSLIRNRSRAPDHYGSYSKANHECPNVTAAASEPIPSAGMLWNICRNQSRALERYGTYVGAIPERGNAMELMSEPIPSAGLLPTRSRKQSGAPDRLRGSIEGILERRTQLISEQRGPTSERARDLVPAVRARSVLKRRVPAGAVLTVPNDGGQEEEGTARPDAGIGSIKGRDGLRDRGPRRDDGYVAGDGRW